MLVFEQSIGDMVRICIGNGIWVTVVAVHGNTVRLGFDADKSIPIMPKEEWLQQREAGKEGTA